MFDRVLCLTAITVFAGASAFAERPAVTDPTAPPTTESTARAAAETGGLLLLYSTQVATSSRSAVINNHVVAVGSRIDGAVVTSIEQGKVTLRRGPESIVLRLILPPVKHHAKDAG